MNTPFQDLNEDFEIEEDLVEMNHSNKFFSQENYLHASAKTKLHHLWNEIARDQKPGKFPD